MSKKGFGSFSLRGACVVALMAAFVLFGAGCSTKSTGPSRSKATATKSAKCPSDCPGKCPGKCDGRCAGKCACGCAQKRAELGNNPEGTAKCPPDCKKPCCAKAAKQSKVSKTCKGRCGCQKRGNVAG